ncbi:hypothetical protein X797_002718 [Metarhizium robertsii]|uniref:Uncharacterized protein n=1 Tax=Metarhizium robertsii TaxID=568076 RepID=A0A0A1V601_9HYPO|nr:hypothetical protein X797_002718 [Metarhizium robertsii]
MPTHTVYIYKVSPTFQVNPVSKLSASSAIKTLPQQYNQSTDNNKMTKYNKKPNTTTKRANKASKAKAKKAKKAKKAYKAKAAKKICIGGFTFSGGKKFNLIIIL